MTRPLRPCGQAGCPTLVASGNCPAHTRVREKDPAQARFYGSTRWKVLRALVRKQEPICVLCRMAPSRVVDHVDGNWQHNERANLRALCYTCNDSHTGRQHRRKQG